MAPYEYDYAKDDPEIKPFKSDEEHPYYNERPALTFFSHTHYPTKAQFVQAKVIVTKNQ